MNSVLAQNWRKCGIYPGDVVLVHSSLKRTLQTHNTTQQAVMESLLEALACGTPVLLSDIPGNREWVSSSPPPSPDFRRVRGVGEERGRSRQP